MAADTTPPRAPVFRCAECEAVWRTQAQRDRCCTAKPETVQQPTIRDEAAELAERILGYFDSYRLGSVAPIAAEIEAALKAAYERGKADAA